MGEIGSDLKSPANKECQLKSFFRTFSLFGILVKIKAVSSSPEGNVINFSQSQIHDNPTSQKTATIALLANIENPNQFLPPVEQYKASITPATSLIQFAMRSLMIFPNPAQKVPNPITTKWSSQAFPSLMIGQINVRRPQSKDHASQRDNSMGDTPTHLSLKTSSEPQGSFWRII